MASDAPERRARPSRRPRPAARPSVPLPRRLPLHVATDGGQPIELPPEGRSWDDALQGFLRQNGAALAALDVRAAAEAGPRDMRVRLYPGARIGAIPLRSGRSAHVRAGLVVRPRFSWAGIGHVLEQTGWSAVPDMLPLPLVPGSGREVPPWVIAGPVLHRLRALLAALRRGYRMAEEVRPGVRGRVDWTSYAAHHWPRGRWGHFPCRFPELGPDPRVRAEVRWALQRVRAALLTAAGQDRLALRLAEEAVALLATLADVPSQRPRATAIHPALGEAAVTAGLQALSWVADERGLGGPAELHGLAWSSGLAELWEGFVVATARRWAESIGGSVSTARERASWVPIRWGTRSAPSLGHLAPDVVIRARGRRALVIVDAKYKAHLAGLDAEGWRAFSEEERATHRADVHQALAYAALFDADVVTTVLAYPLRPQAWERLAEAGRTTLLGEAGGGGRRVRLALVGLPFGWTRTDARLSAAWEVLLGP